MTHLNFSFLPQFSSYALFIFSFFFILLLSPTFFFFLFFHFIRSTFFFLFCTPYYFFLSSSTLFFVIFSLSPFSRLFHSLYLSHTRTRKQAKPKAEWELARSFALHLSFTAFSLYSRFYSLTLFFPLLFSSCLYIPFYFAACLIISLCLPACFWASYFSFPFCSPFIIHFTHTQRAKLNTQHHHHSIHPP